MYEIFEDLLGEENEIYLTDPQDIDLYGVPPLTVRWYKNIKWNGSLIKWMTITSLDEDLIHVEEGFHPPSDEHRFVKCSTKKHLSDLIDKALPYST